MKHIILSQGKYALVDDEDFEFLNQWKWCAHKDGKIFYVIRGIRVGKKTKTILMHRVIMNPFPNQEVDHINGNGLDNQRLNLRICNHAENSRNSKGWNSTDAHPFKGVFREGNKWRAIIKFQYKSIYLGRFDIKEDAALAYDKKARELFGEFAEPNFS